MVLEILVSVLFLVGYALITLEHKLNLQKYITAAALGGLLWVVIAISGDSHIKEATLEMGGEIFGLIIFLFSAMVLIEILVHYQFFDVIRVKLLALKFSDYGQLWVVAMLSFFLSAIIDNLTTTIVMIQISRRFFRNNNLLIAGAAIVICANAGGAFSPIGDVTTIMLWLAGKFSATEILLNGFLPSLSLFAVSTFILAKKITSDSLDVAEERVKLSLSEKVIISSVLASFILPLIFSQIGLEPYLGLLTALGVIGMLIALFRVVHPGDTHLTADIDKMLPKVDFSSLLFFSGILLAVGALRHLGILAYLSGQLFGDEPTLNTLVFGNVALGVLSAIVDNIPLTAAAMTILNTSDESIWILLALTVGTGGSMLSIGSAAGVVAMGMLKELNFFKYIKIATLPAAVGYLTAVGVWYLQHHLILYF